MRTPPLPADFIYTRICKLICAKFLTLPFETGNHCTVYEFVYRNYQIFGKVSFVQPFLYLMSVSSTNFP